MGDAKAFARQAVEEVAGNRFAGGEADAVHKAVELGPGFGQVGEHGFDLGVVGHVTIEDQFGIEFGGEVGDAVFEALAHVAESQLSALLVAGFGDTVSDGAVGQHPCDQQFFTGQKTHCSISLEKSIRIVACER